MAEKDIMKQEFPALENVGGRTHVETKDGYHIYRRKITKGGELEVEKEIKTPANLETAIKDMGLDAMSNALQRRMLDDEANRIRQTELLTETEKRERQEKLKSQAKELADLIGPEELKKLLKE